MDRRVYVFGAGLMLVAAVGCGDDETGSGGSGTGGAASGGAPGTGAGGAGGEAAGAGGSGGAGGGAAATANVRVAHLSPDAPAVDFCVTADGTTFVGPVMKSLGDTDGLAFSEVTQYLPLPVATYTARLVAPNAADCSTSLGGLPDVTGLAVAADGSYTVAAIGMLTPANGEQPFEVTAYGDDADVAAGKAKLRFIHASPDTPNVDVGVGAGAQFTAVFSNVAFSDAGDVAGKSYLETDPLANVTVSARATGTTTDALVIPGVNLPAGAIATAFAIGKLNGDPSPLKVLVCVDNGDPVQSLTPCSVVP